MRTIDFAVAHEPIVLAIDIGSSSVRALMFDGLGQQINDSEAQLGYEQLITADGGSESDPAALLELVVRCVDVVVERATAHNVSIAAVGMTSFWHGLMGLDKHRVPRTPIYMWSDKRSGPADVALLSRDVDPAAAHQRTGCRIHSSYWPAKLRWLQRVRPGQFSQTRSWVSFTDYVYLTLFGDLSTSLSMASGTGLLNDASLDWDRDMLEALSITPVALAGIVDRSEPHSTLRQPFAERWPALQGVPWYPAIGDGAAANVGSGCVGRSRIALTIGTSAAMRIIVGDTGSAGTLPHRIWSYRLDRRHKVLGGALSNGGNVTEWFARTTGDGDFDKLTDAARTIPPDGHGLTMLPFLAGERSPSWNDRATGTISGLTLSTTAGDLFRAGLEATAYRLAAIYDDVGILAATDHEIHANGTAALSSPLWLQIIADTLGHRVDAVDADAEASARGAALCALESIGVLANLSEIFHSVSRRYEPDHVHHQVYTKARTRQSALEAAVDTFALTQAEGEGSH